MTPRPSAPGPLARTSADRIVADLRPWIANAPAGAQLPSTRELSTKHGASPVTVQKALRTLVGLGLVESRPGAGTFVRQVDAPRPADYGWQTSALRTSGTTSPRVPTSLQVTTLDQIGLHTGYPAAELLPERLVRAALGRAVRQDVALNRAPMSGLPELQAWFASELANATPSGLAPPAARDVVVVPGSQSGLSSIFRSVIGTGRPVIMESPTYYLALLAARKVGVEIVPVPSGPHGPDPEDVDRAFRDSGASAFYAIPTFNNPTGAVWSGEVRERILETVVRHNAFLVEDDWAHDFGIEDVSVPLAARDTSGHVIYLRSLTKSMSPALRLAAVVARGPVRERILVDQGAESMYVSPIIQAAALDVALQPGWRTHLRALSRQLASRRDGLVAALAEHAPEATLTRMPTGGLHVWLRLPDGVDEEQVVADCAAAGVLVAGGREWFPEEAPGPHLRLTYSAPNPERFGEAAQAVGEAVRARMR